VVVTLTALIAVYSAGLARADEPLKKIDRAKVVGPPVLDASAEAGVYVWLEEGWYQIAAVTNLPFGTQKRMTKTYKVAISSTKEITDKLGSFKKERGGSKDMKLSVTVGATAERAQFKTEGDVTVSGAVEGKHTIPIFVGPLSKRGAAAVRIGRF
jgi:hypothetical protein